MTFLADTSATSTGYSAMDWAVLAIVSVTAYLLLRNMAKKGKRGDPLADARPRMTLAQQRSTERQMESLLVELSEMARQISSQLDTRSAKLEALLAEAEEKIQKLDAKIAKLRGSSSSSRSQPSSSTSSTSHAAPKSGSAMPAPARRPEPVSQAEERPPMRLVVPEEPAIDPRHAEIYRLADGGLSPREIAHQLNRPSGEVELILALRR